MQAAKLSPDLRETLRSLYWSECSRGDGRVVCPECGPHRRKINQRTKTMSLTNRDGALLYSCHHCGIQGGIKLIAEDRGFKMPAFAMAEREARYLGPIEPAVQELPEQVLSEEGVKFLLGRGVSEETAREAGVVTKSYRLEGVVQEALWFPYLTGGKAYAHKIRGLASKSFSQAGGAATFWLADQAVQGEDLLIVEGEIDALSVREIGHRSVVSVPNGAPVRVSDGKVNPQEDGRFRYVWSGKKMIESAKRVVIAVDKDEPGRALGEELARRIGKAKCWRIVWPDGCKDANDVLMKLGPDKLKECVENPEPWPIAGVYDAKHFADKVRSLYNGGIGKGDHPGWENVFDLYSVCPAHLTVVTGAPGSGKSTWVNALMVNLARTNGWSMGVYSSETPPEVHIPMLAALYQGKPFFNGPTERMTEAELEEGMDWVNEKFIFLHSEDNCTYEEIIERLEVAVMRHGIRGFVVDPANYLKKPANVDPVEWVGEMLSAFRAFAQSHDCHAWVIAHPKKMEPGKAPGGYDISGSSHWFNRPDFGVTIHRPAEARHLTEFHVWKVRFSWTGREGVAELHHDAPTGRFAETPYVGQNVVYSALGAGLRDAYAGSATDPWSGL